MKKNIIMLLILSMLAVQFPSVIVSAANGDALEALSMDMIPTARSINTIVDNNTNLRPAQAHGRATVDRKLAAFSNINYSAVEDGKDWVGFSMELKDGNTRDFSADADAAKIAYTTKFETTADINNLYFVARSANGAITGVSAGSYLAADEDNNGTPDVYEKLVDINIPLNAFTNAAAKQFITGAEFDASKFTGMGIVRCKGETNPESTGKIYFTKMSVVKLAAISDLSAQAASGITLSFTKPQAETIDKYEISKSDGSTTKKILCTADDFAFSEGKYSYTDTDVEAAVDYTYKIRMHETSYDLYSVYSNEVSISISEDDGGVEIPSNNADTIVWDMISRDFEWTSDRQTYSTVYYRGGASESYQKATNNGWAPELSIGTAPVPGLGKTTGKDVINRWLLNPANFKEADSYNPDDGHPYNPYRGYMAVGMSTGRAQGGDAGNMNQCVNIAPYKDTGYVTMWLYIDEGYPLDNLYFSVASQWADGRHHASKNFVALPVTDYISDADKGHAIYVSIPLKDFTLSNPHVFQNLWNDQWSGSDTPDTVSEINWKQFGSIGFIRRVYDGNNGASDAKFTTPEYDNAYIYDGGMYITNVNPVTNFRVYDIKSDKMILKWDHTESAAVKYNIYRTDGGDESTRRLVGETTKNQYSDYYENGDFPVGVTFKYEIEAVDKYGAKSTIESDTATIRSIDHPRKFKAAAQQSQTSEIAVDISWEAPLFGDLAEYVLYRNGTEYRRFTPSETTFRDTDLEEHGEYTYTMKSVANDGSESILTAPVTVSATALGEPSGLTYRIKNTSQVELMYSAPDYAEKFYIYLNGEKIAETDELSYTVEDVPYDTALMFGVRAVNAAGKTSKEAQTEQFIIKNPKMTTAMTIFDDEINSSLTKEPSTGVSMTETSKKSIIGTKSIAFDFTAKKSSKIYANLSGKIDIASYRENGGRLGFWLYADDTVDYSNFKVGVGAQASIGGQSGVAVRSLVPVSDYVTEKNKWVYVEIPLSDISEYAKGQYQTVTQSALLDFTALKQFVFEYDNSKQVTGPVVYLDQITIDTGNTWSVTKTVDDKDVQGSAISADANKLNIHFSEDMNPETLTTAGVSLRYTDEGTYKYVNYYGTYADKIYTMNFLEPLKANTIYTLEINGAKTAEGIGGSYTGRITSNSSTPSSETRPVPAIDTIVTTQTSGSTTTVTVSMPDGRYDLIGNYTVKLAYNKYNIKPNGTSAVTETPDGATVTDTGNSIVVAGTKGKSMLSGTLMKVKFVTVTAGAVSVTVTGTADVYNGKADTVSSAAFSGSASFTANASGTTGPSSGGEGGGGNGASRDNARKPVIDQPKPTEEPASTPESSFTDLDSVPWAKEAVNFLSQKGYINGYDDGTFKPENTITREEFAKMIVNVMGFDSFNYEMTTAIDVDKNAWYANFVTIAMNSGLINGISDNEFGTGINITRQDMCTIIYRAIKSENIKVTYLYDEKQFTDQASDYAQEAIRELYRYGLVNGVSDSEFDPQGSVTRAMAAKVLYGLAKLL